MDDDGHDDASPNCLVCYTEFDVHIKQQKKQRGRHLKDVSLFLRAKTPCDHNEICGICHLRLRFLHEENKCPICKQDNNRIIVDVKAPRVRRFNEYHMWGDDELGPDFRFRADVGMFFPVTYYDAEIAPLFGLQCSQPDCDFDPATTTPAVVDTNAPRRQGKKAPNPLRALQDHLRIDHSLALCQLCVDHKRDFVARLPRFTPRQLTQHMKQGDGPSSGFSGHPLCEFCRPKRFYDLGQLHQHLNRDHYLCHVCDRNGKPNQFFRSYKSLERHFDTQHFLCHDVQCLAARFVVFDTELDLRGHELSVHGGTSTGSTKINLEFRTRRTGYDGSGVDADERRGASQQAPTDRDFSYGVDGQAFVPEALPTTGSNRATESNSSGRNTSEDELHPQHLQRTAELREQAALIRERQNSAGAGEAFPTLQQSNAAASNAPLRTGWAGGSTVQRLQARTRPAGRVTEEDFPSLGGGSSGNTKLSTLPKKKKAAPQAPRVGPSFASASSGAPAIPAAAAAAAAPSGFLTPLSRPRPQQQQQANLQASNFPALGGGSGAGPKPYAAANAYAAARNRSNAARVAPNTVRAAPYAATQQQPQQRQLTAMDFPAPPTSAAASNTRSIRDRMLGDRSPSASTAAMSNVLNMPALSLNQVSDPETTLQEMKATLGPKKFQELKQLTKQFSEHQESAEGYIDQSAMLFEKGYSDPDFWSYLPSLLASCPNRDGSEYAMTYLQSLRRQQFGAETAGKKNAPVQNNNWNNSNNNNNRGNNGIAYAAAAHRPQTIPSKKKASAWGNGGAAPTVMRAKPSPGGAAVATAASQQQPQSGTATKFMAQQQKKGKAKVGGGKKKQKDELRSLAFGN